VVDLGGGIKGWKGTTLWS